jgi:LysM repeat protein
MIKLTTLLIEQKYKYKWVPLQQALPANAVNGYRLKYKERGEGVLVDESDLKYMFSDSRFATKYKNKDYVFYISEVRGTSRKKVYIAYVYRRDNLPANIRLFFTLGIGPTFTVNNVPVFLSSQEKEVSGKKSGEVPVADGDEEKKKAEAARLEAEKKAEEEAKKAVEKETTDTEIETSIYKVVSGDTLAKIAKKHGMSLDDIIKLNPQIQDPNKIFPGQSINISAEAVISPQVGVDKEKDVAPETNSGDRITAGYAISPSIQKIAKDIHTAANYIGFGGTNTELFDSAFDKMKTVPDAFLVNLELARLEGNAAYDLEYVIRGEFSILSGEDERLLKLSRLVGIDDNGDINRPDKSLMKKAANQHVSDQNIDISTLGRRKPGEY